MRTVFLTEAKERRHGRWPHGQMTAAGRVVGPASVVLATLVLLSWLGTAAAFPAPTVMPGPLPAPAPLVIDGTVAPGS